MAFFVLGAPIALLVGALTDSFNRRNLFVAVIALGEGPCLATAYVRSYAQLFAMRALTGISVGGSLPLLFSLLGDLVPPARRSAVSAGVGIAQGAGVALGQVLAGYVGAAHGWRLPFVLVAVPALVLSLTVLLCVEEPRRGAQEAGLAAPDERAAEYRERIEWRKVRHIFAIRTNLLAFAQGVPGCVPWGVMNTCAAQRSAAPRARVCARVRASLTRPAPRNARTRSYFADYMAQDRGLGVASATSMVVIFGAGSVVGSLVGGAGGQWLYNRTPGALGALMAATTAAGALPLLYVVNAASLSGASGMAFLGGVLSCVTGAPARRQTRARAQALTRPPRAPGTNVRAVLIGVNAPETRGTVFAIFNLMDGLGKGLGPAAVASLINAHGRRYAFNVSLSMWLLCGVLLAGIAVTLGDDERALQQRLAAARASAAADGAPVLDEGGGAGGALELQSLMRHADDT